MYDIGIPEIICTARYEDTDKLSIKYDAEAAVRPDKCPNPECASEKLHIHSTNHNLLRDTRSEGKLVFINLKIRRYRCPECGKIIPDKFTFYSKHSHITNRLLAEFVARCIKGETFNYIARDYSVDHKTVARAFHDYAKEHQELLANNYTPEVLGIDEAHIDDHYRLVLTDIKQQRLLDMKKDNHKPTVKNYLRTLDSEVCNCVTMDFAPGYASSVETVLPKTTIVVDKFHVVQEINRCLDKVRIYLQNQYRKQGVDIRRFKRSKRLFMTNWEDLTPKGESALDAWFREFPELYEAYMVKETFRDIYQVAASRESASMLFDAWLDSVPLWSQFKAMISTFTKRKHHILNYWDYPWTNAYTESVNNTIKKIEKAGRGYKFEVLRERCLLEINAPKPEKFVPKNAKYISVDNNYSMVAEKAVEYGDTQRKEQLYLLHETVDYMLDDVGALLTIYLESFNQERYETTQKRLETYLNAIQSLCITD